MSEKITSILFLVIVGLALVGMVVGIAIAIFKRVGRGQAYKSAASRQGWRYIGSDTEAVNRVETILKPTLYTIQRGDHDISQVITGDVGGRKITVVRYHFLARPRMPGHGKGGTYVLVIFERGGQRGGERGGRSERFSIMHRFKGALGAVAERAVGGSAPSDPAWAWSLFSPAASFDSIVQDADAGRRLGELTQPGDAVFVFEDIIVFGMQGELKKSRSDEIKTILPLLFKVLR